MPINGYKYQASRPTDFNIRGRVDALIDKYVKIKTSIRSGGVNLFDLVKELDSVLHNPTQGQAGLKLATLYNANAKDSAFTDIYNGIKRDYDEPVFKKLFRDTDFELSKMRWGAQRMGSPSFTDLSKVLGGKEQADKYIALRNKWIDLEGQRKSGTLSETGFDDLKKTQTKLDILDEYIFSKKNPKTASSTGESSEVGSGKDNVESKKPAPKREYASSSKAKTYKEQAFDAKGRKLEHEYSSSSKPKGPKNMDAAVINANNEINKLRNKGILDTFDYKPSSSRGYVNPYDMGPRPNLGGSDLMPRQESALVQRFGKTKAWEMTKAVYDINHPRVQATINKVKTIKQIEVNGKTYDCKVSKISSVGKFGCYAFIVIQGMAEPLVMNIMDYADGEMNGSDFTKNIIIAGGKLTLTLAAFKVGEKVLFSALTKIGAVQLGALLGKAIPIVGWALTAVSVIELVDKAMTKASVNNVTIYDMALYEEPNPLSFELKQDTTLKQNTSIGVNSNDLDREARINDANEHKYDTKGLKYFDLEQADTKICKGEMEIAVMLFQMGYLNPEDFVVNNEDPTGKLNNNVESRANSFNIEYRQNETIGLVQGAGEGREEQFFRHLRNASGNKALFRSLLKAALTQFRGDLGYLPPDGVEGHITPADCETVLVTYQSYQNTLKGPEMQVSNKINQNQGTDDEQGINSQPQSGLLYADTLPNQVRNTNKDIIPQPIIVTPDGFQIITPKNDGSLKFTVKVK